MVAESLLKKYGYGNFNISCILQKNKELKCICYAKKEPEHIIEVTFDNIMQTNFMPGWSNVPNWDFNIDEYLFNDLENGYSLMYLAPMDHYAIWQQIEIENGDFYHKSGLQSYLKYCKENDISSVIKALGLYELDIMPLYIEKNINYVIVNEFTINDQSIVLGYNKDSVNPYVTWRTDKTRSRGYDLGHYFTNCEEAINDFISRSDLLYDNQKAIKRENLKIKRIDKERTR